GTAALAIAFLLRFGGLTYPQFLTSDLLLHVHYVQRVLAGEWLFTGLLPDGTPVPYPPALYVLVAPLAGLLGSSDQTVSLILKWTVSALDSLTCLGLAWSGSRLASGLVGGLAALLYAVLPGAFELMSAGNYSNLFAQSVLNLTLLGGLVYVSNGAWSGGNRAFVTGSLALGFFLTMLGHYGMMLSALAIMVIFTVLSVWSAARGKDNRHALSLIAAYMGTFAVAVAVYYVRYSAEIAAQFGSLFERLLARGQAPAGEQSPGPVEPIEARYGRKLARLVGVMSMLLATFSVALTGRLPMSTRHLLASWLAASGIFFILDQTLGDAIRWYYLAAAPIAFLGALYLSRLALRGKAARLLCMLALASALLHVLDIWVGDLIFTRYH
ncbi:MAG TPA: hypothetical protein VM409_03030, partial [Chloroflexia bacterium]|nr:hypothetical protein [Chloroflexia bacterium]